MRRDRLGKLQVALGAGGSTGSGELVLTFDAARLSKRRRNGLHRVTSWLRYMRGFAAPTRDAREVFKAWSHV